MCICCMYVSVPLSLIVTVAVFGAARMVSSGTLSPSSRCIVNISTYSNILFLVMGIST